jgi:DNA-binding transcriptional regulator YdaS (Cro superfamily)
MVGIGDRIRKCAVIEHKAASTVLAKAAEKVGGRKALAERLGVRYNDLSQYIDGNLPVSEDLYLKAVDIVLGDPAQDPKH